MPVTSLFRGADVERPAAFVKSGTGARIVRNGTREGHEYQLLGSLRGEHKRLECLHVTLSEKSQTYPLFQHPGTEFIYMLEGVMDYGHSRSVYRLHPGDSLQIDGEGAHGPDRPGGAAHPLSVGYRVPRLPGLSRAAPPVAPTLCARRPRRYAESAHRSRNWPNRRSPRSLGPRSGGLAREPTRVK